MPKLSDYEYLSNPIYWGSSRQQVRRPDGPGFQVGYILENDLYSVYDANNILIVAYSALQALILDGWKRC